ncbi:MAG: hypothetical protein ACQRW7_06750 [Caulobacterales bacterium]|uniref:hypothetical protein n=1 Tax=Glycocaulis sp. TaxID=1969725 RepID=UPI003FA0E6F0
MDDVKVAARKFAAGLSARLRTVIMAALAACVVKLGAGYLTPPEETEIAGGTAPAVSARIALSPSDSIHQERGALQD